MATTIPITADRNSKFPFSRSSHPDLSLLHDNPNSDPSISSFNSATYLRARSYLKRCDTVLGADRPPALSQLIAQRLPETLEEVVLPTYGYDKVFASHWIDDHHVLVGTKCNQLLLINTRSSRIVEVPYLSVTTNNAISSDNSSLRGATNPIRSPLFRDLPSSSTFTSPFTSSPSTYSRPGLMRYDSGIHDATSLNARGSHESYGSSHAVGFVNPRDHQHDSTLACVGIHSIAVNPSRTRLAVGSGKPYEVVVYSLPELVPICLLTGHMDLVFSVVFVSDDVIVTGSRDTTLGVFSLRSDSAHVLATEHGNLPVIKPLGIRQEHTGKVRDLRYHPDMRQLVSLGLDGTVRVWDVNRMHVTSKTSLHFPHETVCLGLDPTRPVVSVGSQANVSLLDTRKIGSRGERIVSSARHLYHFKSLDEGWGVRSLAHRHHIITCGGGMGRLGFYDLRSLGYIPVGPNYDNTFLEASFNHGNESSSLDAANSTGIVRSAIYTINYSEDGTRLFTGGGPLQLGLRGSYCAIW